MLILINKSDLPSYTDVDTISDNMQLYSLRCKDYVMLPCSAISKDGINSAMNWIIEAVQLGKRESGGGQENNL